MKSVVPIIIAAFVVLSVLVLGTYQHTAEIDALALRPNQATPPVIMVADSSSFWVQSGGPLGPRR